MRLELTRRADYAIRALLALARAPDAVVAGPRLAEEMAIPARFVAQVMTDLVRAGYVTTRIGRAGGYAITGAGRDATVLDVVEAVEGDTRSRTCVLRGGPCRREESCEVHDVFARGQDALRRELGSTAIAALAGAPPD